MTDTTKRRTASIVSGAMWFALVAFPASAQQGRADAPNQAQYDPVRWINNCIANMATPEAREAYTSLGKVPPSHAENITWCKAQWNIFHPDQKITPQNEDRGRDGWRYPPTPIEWIYDCVDTYDGPRGRRVAASRGIPIPTHAENMQRCTQEWNAMKPSEAVLSPPPG